MLKYFNSLSVEDAMEALEELEAYEGYDAEGNDLRNKCVVLTDYHLYLCGCRCLMLRTPPPTANADAQVPRVCEASQRPLCIYRRVY